MKLPSHSNESTIPGQLPSMPSINAENRPWTAAKLGKRMLLQVTSNDKGEGVRYTFNMDEDDVQTEFLRQQILKENAKNKVSTKGRTNKMNIKKKGILNHDKEYKLPSTFTPLSDKLIKKQTMKNKQKEEKDTDSDTEQEENDNDNHNNNNEPNDNDNHNNNNKRFSKTYVIYM